MRGLLFIGLFFAVCFDMMAQNLNTNWDEEVNNSLYEFMACDEPVDDISPCNEFVGEALEKVYEVNDFYSEHSGRYLLANEIAEYLNREEKWTLLGNANDQEALTDAQSYANLEKAIVAVLKSGTGYGHVAIILPGQLERSGAWGLDVPNSASFFIYKPERSYINKKLSYAFKASDKQDVLLYGRNY